MSRRIGRVLVGIGAVCVAASSAVLALIMNWLPLDDLLPATIHMTGPVRATTAVFVWTGVYFLLGVALVVLGRRAIASASR